MSEKQSIKKRMYAYMYVKIYRLSSCDHLLLISILLEPICALSASQSHTFGEKNPDVNKK